MLDQLPAFCDEMTRSLVEGRAVHVTLTIARLFLHSVPQHTPIYSLDGRMRRQVKNRLKSQAPRVSVDHLYSAWTPATSSSSGVCCDLLSFTSLSVTWRRRWDVPSTGLWQTPNKVPQRQGGHPEVVLRKEQACRNL